MIGILALFLLVTQPAPGADGATPPPPQTPAPPPAAMSTEAAMPDALQLVCTSKRGSFSSEGESDAMPAGGRQAELEIDGGIGRMRLPHAVLQTNGGIKAKWVAIKKLVVTDRELRGTVSKGFMDDVEKFRVDRLSGMMAVGLGKHPDFVGHCETYDQAIAHRAF